MPENIPAWVSEGSVRKYYRAIDTLKKESKEVTEAAIKELYIKWAGLVLDDTEVAAPVAEPVAAPVHRRARKAE